jgi:hypothetical protein
MGLIARTAGFVVDNLPDAAPIPMDGAPSGGRDAYPVGRRLFGRAATAAS